MTSRQREQGTAAPWDSAQTILSMLNGTALEVIVALADAQKTVSTLADELELDISTISHTLQRLRTQSLVKCETCRQRRLYCLSRHIRVQAAGASVLMMLKAQDASVVSIELPRKSQE